MATEVQNWHISDIAFSLKYDIYILNVISSIKTYGHIWPQHKDKSTNITISNTFFPPRAQFNVYKVFAASVATFSTMCR